MRAECVSGRGHHKRVKRRWDEVFQRHADLEDGTEKRLYEHAQDQNTREVLKSGLWHVYLGNHGLEWAKVPLQIRAWVLMKKRTYRASLCFTLMHILSM